MVSNIGPSMPGEKREMACKTTNYQISPNELETTQALNGSTLPNRSLALLLAVFPHLPSLEKLGQQMETDAKRPGDWHKSDMKRSLGYWAARECLKVSFAGTLHRF